MRKFIKKLAVCILAGSMIAGTALTAQAAWYDTDSEYWDEDDWEEYEAYIDATYDYDDGTLVGDYAFITDAWWSGKTAHYSVVVMQRSLRSGCIAMGIRSRR